MLLQLKQAQQIIKDMVDPLTGKINFGFIYTMGARIAPLLTSRFSRLKDNQAVKFQFKQGNSHQIIQWLQEEKLDVALTSKIADQPLIICP